VGGTSSGGWTNLGGVTGGTTAVGVAGAAGTAGGGTGGGAGASGGESPQSCPALQTPLVAGDHPTTLQHDGRSRTYMLHVPSGVTGTEPVALIFDLHGAGGDGLQQQRMSGWEAVADREGLLVVYPDGVDGYWNVDDTCCGTAGAEQIDDVGLIRAIVDQLSGQACIDAQRIYVSGFSNGGGLAHRMGCDAADLIAAIAPVATDLRTQPCVPVRPISMMEVRGMSDSLEPYEGGVVGPPGGQYVSPGAQGSLQLWADINQCAGTPTTIEQYCESYTECGDGVETDLCSLPGVDHGSYNNSLGFAIASVAWRMFERQPMK
jgi:polyhydroxybutyrate depolymerase